MLLLAVIAIHLVKESKASLNKPAMCVLFVYVVCINFTVVGSLVHQPLPSQEKRGLVTLHTANFSCVQMSHIVLIFMESSTEIAGAHAAESTCFASKHKRALTFTVSRNNDLTTSVKVYATCNFQMQSTVLYVS